ncbi:MAG: SIS domain-containing protein [Bacteroidota bacterium]
MFEYQEKAIQQLNDIVLNQENAIMQAAEYLAACIINDHIIHTFGTGHSHMIGLELFVRAGGLANVNAMLDSMVLTSEGSRRSAEIERISGLSKIIYNQHKISQNDIMIIISNSGR